MKKKNKNPKQTRALSVASDTLFLFRSRCRRSGLLGSLQVTVFVYTDLMLVTREDEPGRCNVLQSPLFLRQLRLQDGTSPPAAHLI